MNDITFKMRKHSAVEKKYSTDFKPSSRNWLLHARFVRGEHTMCLDLADKLQQETENRHRYAHYIKGAILADAGRLQEAVEKYHSCIRLQPQDPEPLKEVAKCLYRQGRFQLALEAYLEAEKVSKHHDPDIYCGLAECAAQTGDERDLEWARRASGAGGSSSAEGPERAGGETGGGGRAWERAGGETGGGGRAWERAGGARGGERAAALLAARLLAAGDAPAAMAAYEHAVTEHSCGADTLAAAGALCLRVGEPRRAFRLLGEALSRRPAQHGAALALAAMMLRHGDADAALARLKAALGTRPACVAAHSDLGLALLIKKKYIAALTCASRAAAGAPLSGAAAHNAGLALLASRRPASAFCRLAAAAALRPARARTVLLIAVALERLEDGRADAAFARAAALGAGDALVRLRCGARAAAAGRAGDAARDAAAAARLLRDRPDAQLESVLASLVESLREVGVTPETSSGTPEPDTEEVNSHSTNELAADEV